MDIFSEVWMKLQNYKNNIYSRYRREKKICNSQRENRDTLVCKKEVNEPDVVVFDFEDRVDHLRFMSTKSEKKVGSINVPYFCLFVNILLTVFFLVVLVYQFLNFLNKHLRESCPQPLEDDHRLYTACNHGNDKSATTTLLGHVCSLSFTGNAWYILLDLILSQKMRNLSTPTFPSDKSYFHGDVDIKDLEKNKLSWRDPHASVFHKGNIRKEESGYITKPGIYYLYNQITIKTMENDQNSSLTHSLCVSSDNGHNCKVLTSNTSKRIKGTMTFQTSFLEGLFYLRKGEIIKVLVSDKSAVYRFGNGNYFGFYMVTNRK